MLPILCVSVCCFISLGLQLIHLHPLHLTFQIIASECTKRPNTAIHLCFSSSKAATSLCLCRDCAEQCHLGKGCATASSCHTLIPMHGDPRSAKPCCTVGHGSCETGAKRQLFICKVCPFTFVHEICDFKVHLEVCWHGLRCNRICKYILCSIPLCATMAGLRSLRGRVGGWLEVAQHQVHEL